MRISHPLKNLINTSSGEILCQQRKYSISLGRSYGAVINSRADDLGRFLDRNQVIGQT